MVGLIEEIEIGGVVAVETAASEVLCRRLQPAPALLANVPPALLTFNQNQTFVLDVMTKKIQRFKAPDSHTE